MAVYGFGVHSSSVPARVLSQLGFRGLTIEAGPSLLSRMNLGSG
jgi:hypothetical protein